MTRLRDLLRGRSAEMRESAIAANATTILGQNIRDAALAIRKGREAMALLAAQIDAEKARKASLIARRVELEDRALDALRQDRADLAEEAAAIICDLTADIACTETAIARLQEPRRRHRQVLERNEQRLRELQRGHALLRIADHIPQDHRFPGQDAALLRGERMLASARADDRRRQVQEDALHASRPEARLERLDARMIEAGCAPRKVDAVAHVLANLKTRLADAPITPPHA